MLDVLDKELEKRDHRFVRYADDCNIYVRSERAGERVMAGIEQYLAKRLKLKVNKAKSAVAKPSIRKFLGFSFTSGKQPRRRIAPQAIDRFKAKVRALTRRTGGRSLSQVAKELSCYLIGWRAYFGFCETPSVLRDLDQWIRRRLRAIAWKQWRRGRTRFAELRRCGVGRDLAAQTAGSPPWPLAAQQQPRPRHRASEGLLRFAPPRDPRAQACGLTSVEPPYTDPYVRWCGRGGAARLPPIPISESFRCTCTRPGLARSVSAVACGCDCS